MYRIELTRQAAKELEQIHRSDRTLYQRFIHSMEAIADDPMQGKPLHGQLKGLLSYRLGSYRILYEIHHHRLVVIVIDLGHRRAIYK